MLASEPVGGEISGDRVPLFSAHCAILRWDLNMRNGVGGGGGGGGGSTPTPVHML